MTKDEIETIRAIVRMETNAAIKQHLYALTAGCLAPIATALEQVLQNQKLLSDGQTLVERSLIDRPDDGEPWRESLEPDGGA